MRREGFEPFAPMRAVAAASEEKVIATLGCPEKWFKLHFYQAGKRDQVIADKCREAPETVFELHFEEHYRNARIERDHHWVPVEKVGEFLKQQRRKQASKGKNQAANDEGWKERIKNVKKPISLKATG